MNSVSATPSEKSRKAYASFLQALQDDSKQGAIAVAMAVSESTVSRIKSDKVEDALNLLYHAGFKLVPSTFVCVDRATYEAINLIASRAMSNPTIARHLSWDGES